MSREPTPEPDDRRAVLVAGGTGALGGAVVRELLSDGREVTATWIRKDERERLESELGGEPRFGLVEANLGDPEGAGAAVAAAGPSLGAVVNLVGGYAGGHRVGDADPGELDRMIALNLRPLFLLARAAMPVLVGAGGGALVGVSARPAVEPRGGDSAYAAAKAAVLGLIRSVAAEYRDDGVRANAVLPSAMDTPANRAAMPKADHSRWVPPEEVARVIRFLVSEASAPTSGAAIPVYGRA
jgi:NAD(P)-dependent dehydrogenase (short-subunit alcohol dehydrogenase family)